jgi:dTDP-4-amino-4,6-dideoxy-D-galactose acyltransferase
MHSNIFEPLEWDSKFFGYPVARIIFDHEGGSCLDDLFLKIKSEKTRLVYFIVPPAEKGLINSITSRGGIFVDQKIVFSKVTEKHNNLSEDVVEFKGSDINERLINLVLRAGLYSRFRIDENFKNQEYERLYIEWLYKSINKSIAFKTLIAKKGSDIIGITTLGRKTHDAHIGLVAVDENFSGQGIGYNLVHSADTVASEMGLSKIKVVTQSKNKSACRLYEKCNFHIEKITNIFHYWQ